MATGIQKYIPRAIGASCLAAALAGTAGVMSVQAAPRTAAKTTAESKSAMPNVVCRLVLINGQTVVVSAVTGQAVDPRLCNRAFVTTGATTTGATIGGLTGGVTTGATTTGAITTGVSTTTGATVTGATVIGGVSGAVTTAATIGGLASAGQMTPTAVGGQ
ncbi:hypothetical protein ACFOZ0_20585 [Streptomyces yaanensis]|uniref:Uncharacterized protein n=1 Tax=Streptomyces yaanensis TaxID=1142239 RepID=A0ABV7SID3_9ACTN|nr:hypothetical protein [Streptomyces sp. CGMCC 4.7035]WNB97757.1 hypothetical protein Q2K21_06515 [Streptomyces sp. CGMCC 4.7035]